MSELVNKVAEILNAPVDLVQRSAEARAQASGKSVEEVLSSWAGGESITASAAPASEDEAPVEEVKEEVEMEIEDKPDTGEMFMKEKEEPPKKETPKQKKN